MDTPALIDSIEINGNRLLDVASAGLDAPVAACPEWDVARLVVHIGQVHSWMTETIEADTTQRPSHPFVDAPAGDLIAWERDILSRLVEVLRSTDPQRPSWTWGTDQHVSFYARRMAQETLVHRWDVENALGEVTPIDSELACDGVDELIHVGMQSSTNPKRVFEYPSGSLHLHRTDGAGEWLLRLEEGRLVATREHAKGDVAVRGAAPDLLLYLWGRRQQNLEIFGDQGLADAWATVGP